MSPELNATEVFPASKSLFIRALLAKSYFPELKIDSKASSDDVRFCQLAVHKITTQSGSLSVDAGAAGAVFRFLALRLSRIEGKHFIAGTPKLLTRGMNELEKTLSFLGAEVKKLGHGWEIYSQPHKWVSNSQKALSVNTSTSSQVASGVILNSWGLKEDFVLRLEGEARSESYLEMTLKLFDELGGKIKRVSQTEILIPAAQKVRLLSYQPEIDFSCVFSWVATKILHCSYKVHGIPALSLQGDAQFVEFLQNAGVAIEIKNNTLAWQRPQSIKGIGANLASCPDLFPSLAVLLAFAKGPSVLWGAPHLRQKESDRITAIESIFLMMGVKFKSRNDGIEILSQISPPHEHQPVTIDPKDDHRIAMAAEILVENRYNVEILSKDCVNKSYPNFFEIVAST